MFWKPEDRSLYRLLNASNLPSMFKIFARRAARVFGISDSDSKSFSAVLSENNPRIAIVNNWLELFSRSFCVGNA